MRSKFLFGLSLAFLAVGGVAHAAPGDLDTTFNGTGTATTAVTTGADNAWDVLVQPDGKVVTGGQARGTNTDFAIVRRNDDGTLDGSFGTGGVVTTPIGTADEIARAVLRQPDGKLLLAGYARIGANNDFAVVRYDEDGTLDPTFGTGGIATTPIGAGNDNGFAAALQPDGKIVVAGYATLASLDFAVVRFNDDGTLDGTFGTGGIVTVAVGPSTDVANEVAIQADGKIVVAGYTSNAGVFEIAVLRLNDDGTLDTGFDGDGLAITPVAGTYAIGSAIALHGDGRITVAGSTNPGTGNDFAVVRYLSDGSLDTSFDGDGKLALPIGAADDQARAVALQADGKIVVAGLSNNGTDYALALAKIDGNGSLDATFGTAGIVTTDVGGDDGANAVVVQGDGRIVAAGFTGPTSTPDTLAARYENVVAVCGDGNVDAGEACDQGLANGAADSCCSASCTLVTAGTECRAPGDACELAATCDGASPICPANPAGPDTDGDGDCDAIDACTTLDPGQVFATRPKSRTVLTKINSDATPGNDGLVVSAFFTLPPGRSFSELTPLADGVRVVLQADDGTTRLDATLPGGAYDTGTKVGWKLSGNGKTWRFTDKNASPAGGIAQVVINDKATGSTPRRVKVTVKGKKSTYPVVGPDAPIRAIVTLGDATAADEGLCGESDYAAPDCAFNAVQNKLTCRR